MNLEHQKRPSNAMALQRKPRRPRKEIPKMLSSEAQLAMSQLQEDIILSSQTNSTVREDSEIAHGPVESSVVIEKCEQYHDTVHSSTIVNPRDVKTKVLSGTFNEVYERLDILRLEGDITLSSETPGMSPSKRCFGGGKLFNAMEVVETVIFGQETYDPEVDDIGKEDTARLISLQKCRVWFDAQKDYLAIPPVLHSSPNQLPSSSQV